MNLPSIFKSKPDADILALRGSRVPKFERSVLYAASRDGLRILAEVHQASPEVVDQWLDSENGKQLRNLYRDFIAHVSLVGKE